MENTLLGSTLLGNTLLPLGKTSEGNTQLKANAFKNRKELQRAPESEESYFNPLYMLGLVACITKFGAAFLSYI